MLTLRSGGQKGSVSRTKERRMRTYRDVVKVANDPIEETNKRKEIGDS